MTGVTDELDNRPQETFIYGVVEGFYGTPWTTEQRKLLFSWLRKMGLTTYMYAPKDDCKHRAFWRELYSVEEAEKLTGLIEATKEHNIKFVYALSPGLDITFSNPKDVQALKRKLEQVSTFGCESYALLFDDIEPELSEADRSVFQSFAYAQVSVTNEVFEHLGQPGFFFCPTEYCSSRAFPNLQSSGYLITVGNKLLPGIEVLWTGSKVVTKHVTIQHLQEVTAVLKRPPVLWDNIHANDYDPRRLFLGPYDGRSPEIIPYIRGVLTNPNCEFEMNYVALHTLSQWSKSNADRVKKDIIFENRLSPVASDIKLETECELGSDEDIPNSFDTRYQPRRALECAITEWFIEFSEGRQPQLVYPALVQSPNVNLDISPMLNMGNLSPKTHPLKDTEIMFPPVCVDPIFLQPPMKQIALNSLAPCMPVSEKNESTVDMEPMDFVHSSASEENLMQMEMCSDCNQNNDVCDRCLSQEDVSLLVDFFYLPFDHGTRGVKLLQELHWLKLNAHLVMGTMKQRSAEVAEWLQKAEEFHAGVEKISKMTDRLMRIKNRSLLSDLYPYLWDLLGILETCDAYVKWLGLGRLQFKSVCQLPGNVTWFTTGYKEAFKNGEQEPWVFRSGLQGEFERMLPVETVPDLFLLKAPAPPYGTSRKMYSYRPYFPSDESRVFNICLKTCDDGMDGTEVFPDMPDLIADRLVGPFVILSSELCFVVEDQEGVCGYALASLDALALQQKCNMAWIPAMCNKYHKPNKTDLSPSEEVILSFHTEQRKLSNAIAARYPSVLRLDILPNHIEDPAVPKRLLACVISALKTNGSIGVHVELNVGDKYMLEFYRKLGFFPISVNDAVSDEILYLGRII
ncbi:hypothetical protein ScPMuIL_000532 [Solemya velum]